MKKQPQKTDKITIKGEVVAISFRTSEGWACFKVRHENSIGAIINCTGILADMIDVGTEVTCVGIFENGKFGKQLKSESIVPAAPDVETDSGVIKLLQRLPGIGPKKAAEAVQRYGRDLAWRHACESPGKIGVKADQAEEARAIASSLLDSYEATVYLLSLGLSDYQAATIFKAYGKDSIQVVSEDPYRLMEIDGIGFRRADLIAMKAGIAINNPARINACILYVLSDSATNGGHIWFTGWSLCELVLTTLTETAMGAGVPMANAPDKKMVRTQIYFLQAEGKLAIEDGKVFDVELMAAESRILEFIGDKGGEGDKKDR